LTGWPSAVIRAGTDSRGLPIGIQILAEPFAEHNALAIAAWLEERLGCFDKPDLNDI
jgi:amidase